MVDTRDLNRNLSALPEREEVEYRKFKEALTGNADGNLEPSLQKRKVQRLDTVHLRIESIYDEGIVRTTN